jgi:hypothetical protein
VPIVGSNRHEISKHRSWLHRRELIGVSQEDQGALGMEGSEQTFKKLKIHHRGLVQDDQGLGKRKLLVVAVVSVSRVRAQKAVERLTRRRIVLQPLVGKGGIGQASERPRDGVPEAVCGLPGGSRQGYPHRGSFVQKEALKEAQDRHHDGCLPGAGSTGDAVQPHSGGRPHCFQLLFGQSDGNTAGGLVGPLLQILDRGSHAIRIEGGWTLGSKEAGEAPS